MAGCVTPSRFPKANDNHERISENWQVNPPVCCSGGQWHWMSAFGWVLPQASQLLADIGSQRQKLGAWGDLGLMGRMLSFQVYYRKWGLKSTFSSVKSLSRVRLFATAWIAACQSSLSITNSWSLLKLMSIKSVMPSSHLIFCRPLLLLPSIPPSVRDFSNESTLHMRWPKYWSFSFSPSNEHPGLISFKMDWI